MNTYRYRAVNHDGDKVRGVVQAVDEFEAVAKIKATCPVVTKITPVKEGGEGFWQKEIGSSKVDPKSLSVMCSQFSIILGSGVPIAKCMELIGQQAEDKKIRKMLKKAAEDVAQGHGIASSFEKNCSGLPLTFVETIRAGEFSGTLENSFGTLEKYYEKSFKTNQKVKQAMSYPIFVLIVAVIVLIVVMAKVVPSLTATFMDLGGDLPGITRMMIAMSNFFAKYWLLMIGFLLLVIIGLKFYSKTEKGRIKLHTLRLKIPILGKIALLNGASQFANTMSALLEAGLSVHNALEITSKVMDNYVLGLETARMSGRIEEGRQLGECMRMCKFFPETLVEMCAIGEQTGELDETLETVGSYFDNEAAHATEKAISKLEPTILVFMALFAGFIVISIYLPMFTMYNMM